MSQRLGEAKAHFASARNLVDKKEAAKRVFGKDLSESEMEGLERSDTDKLDLLRELEQTRQETNVSVDELRQRSQELYNTDQIRDLSVQQIQELQNHLGNGH